MKRMKLLYTYLLVIMLTSFSTVSIGAETQREWLTSVCYQLKLSVMDKFNGEVAYVKYIVTSTDGSVYVAERNATGDSNSSEVIFPNDFHDVKLNMQASVDCHYGEKYKWAIYINNALIDNGTIAFTRENESK